MLRHFIVWFVVYVVLTLASPLVHTRQAITSRAIEDWEIQSQLLGPTLARYAANFSENIYKYTITPIETRVMNLVIVDQVNPDEVAPVLKLGEWYYSLVDHILTLFIALHSAILRLTILGTWLVVLSPLLLACVVEGVTQHRIKKQEFGVHNPVKANAAWHSLIILLFGPAAYFATNLPVPFVCYPACAIAIGFCCIPLLSHTQRLS